VQGRTYREENIVERGWIKFEGNIREEKAEKGHYYYRKPRLQPGNTASFVYLSSRGTSTAEGKPKMTHPSETTRNRSKEKKMTIHPATSTLPASPALHNNNYYRGPGVCMPSPLQGKHPGPRHPSVGWLVLAGRVFVVSSRREGCGCLWKRLPRTLRRREKRNCERDL
jgi:hypothetical protein